MPNGSEDNSQSQDIGSLLMQAERWERIEDWVKAGIPISGIAKLLLEEDADISAHYERTGSTNPQKTLSNVIAYHVRDKMPLADRVGHGMIRAFFERETGGINVIENLKQIIDLQKERAGKAVEFERKLGMVTQQAGRELMNLTNMLNTLGKLMIAAGMRLEPESRPVEKQQESQDGGRVLYTFIEVLKRHGYSDARAIELATGIPNLARNNELEPDPLGIENINLIDLMNRSEQMQDMLAEQPAGSP